MDAKDFCLRTSSALANAACPLDDKPYVRTPLNDHLHALAWWWFVKAHEVRNRHTVEQWVAIRMRELEEVG